MKTTSEKLDRSGSESGLVTKFWFCHQRTTALQHTPTLQM